MKIVFIRLTCAVIILIVISIIYVVLQKLADKGVRLLKHQWFCWLLSFAVGILVFLLCAKYFLE